MYRRASFASERKLAAKIIVKGIVQGVGFRPFIWHLARRFDLKGYVRNVGGSGVEIFVEGTKEKILKFLSSIKNEKPPPAKIENICVNWCEPQGFSSFEIVKSSKKEIIRSIIPPDFGMCEYCLKEITNPKSRFYRFPFHSCAWCGPRFSIIESLPYDRENTTMVDFPLCEECLSEYNDPNNIRRFHIQGISCPKCGPKVWITDKKGNLIETNDPIKEAAKLIDDGYIVAVKGLGGFHIAALATDDDVVLELRKRKRRPQKPFALMALNLEIAKKIVVINKKAEITLTSPERPIILLPEKEDNPVSRYVAPGLSMQGVMLAYTPLHYLLLSETKDKFLIMTSGNPKGQPMCTKNEEALKKLNTIVDFFLLHNRRIANRVDDSVVRFTDGNLTFIRRGRGYAPVWIEIPIELETSVIAFGAELQNTGAVAFENKVVLTPYIGDTNEFTTLMDLDKTLRKLIKFYEIEPAESIIVADKHPLYSSRRLAEEWANHYGVDIIFVQHHVAHVASVLADYGLLDEPIVGIAIDGIGYGDDGNIWGCEIFAVKHNNFQRVHHLEYYPMPGGDLAVRYPVRMLISYLSRILDEEEIISFLKSTEIINKLKYGEKEAKIVLNQLKNSVKTSSIGRLLDAISSLLKICFERTYEGEPAIKLEAVAFKGRYINPEPEFLIKNDVILVDKAFEWILEHFDKRREDIAKTILLSLGKKLGEVAVKNAKRIGADKIVVSGGAAVNEFLIKGIRKIAKEEDMNVLLPKRVPAGDGGISLGQVFFVALRNY